MGGGGRSCDMGAGLSAVIRAGGPALSDNWPWDSVAARRTWPGQEINDVVLALPSPSHTDYLPAATPEVKERTITQT